MANPEREDVKTTKPRYRRSEAIKKYAQQRADGNCEQCGKPAPFERGDGTPYLEVHHVDELGQGGSDDPSKVVALCPACHSEIHYGKNGDQINQELKDRLEQGLGDAGKSR